MEMKENSQKKVLLSVLGVAILVVAVIGISFAAYTTTFKTEANSISTGTIMVSYTEPDSAINIDDALPTSDAVGVALSGAGKTFDFTVSTQASNALTVPYTITLTPDANNTLQNSEVKVYLTKNGTAVSETPATNAKHVSDLTAATGTRAGSFVLHTDSDVYTTTGEAAKTSSYVLRMWVADTVVVDGEKDNAKTYKAKVNVDSAVTPIA